MNWEARISRWECSTISCHKSVETGEQFCRSCMQQRQEREEEARATTKEVSSW